MKKRPEVYREYGRTVLMPAEPIMYLDIAAVTRWRGSMNLDPFVVVCGTHNSYEKYATITYTTKYHRWNVFCPNNTSNLRQKDIYQK